MILARCLRNRDSYSQIAQASSDWAVTGGVVGITAVLGAGLFGLKSLPEWTEIPAVVVATQTGFSLLLGRVLTRRYGPLSANPADPTYEQVAFAVFGAITLPGTVVFIVVMTLVTAF